MLLQVAQQANDVSIVTAYLPVLITLLIINGWVLWRRYRSRRVLLERVAELEELSQAGSAIVAAQLDFAALCALIVAEANKIIATNTFQLGFFSGNLYQIQAWMIDGVPREPRTFDLRDNSGLIGWVRQSKQPLLVQNFEEEMTNLPAQPRYVDRTPSSFIYIPLVSGDKAIGVLGAYSDTPHYFSHKQMRQLTILANQAAAAIESARLFESERKRAAQVELIGRITHQINATQGLGELFTQVVTLTQKTFGFFQVNIYILDPKQEQLILKASSEPGMPLGDLVFSCEEGLIGTAVTTQQTIISNNTEEDDRCITTVGIPEVDALWMQAKSMLATPLIVNDAVWGVLEVLSEQVGTFASAEKKVLETLAAGVEIAIQKAQRIRHQREQAWLTTARLQVAEAISRSEELDEMLDSLARLIPLLTRIQQCGFLLWHPTEKYYAGSVIYGVNSQTKERFTRGRWPIGTWGALDAVHVGRQPLTTHQRPPWLTTRQTAESLTLFPLISDRTRVGVLFAGQIHPANGYLDETADEDDTSAERCRELLQDTAAQTAQAVERIQLRLAQQEEAWVNTALLQVAGAVNNLIDLNEILHTIVRFAPMLIGVEVCLVLIWDKEQNIYRPGPSYGISEMGRGVLATLEMSRRELQEMAVKEPDREAHLMAAAAPYGLNLPPWLKRVLGVPKAQAVPLVAQRRLVGAMIVGLAPEDSLLKGRRLNIFLGIAQQAATAVLNNQLYKESAERNRLEQELDVARSIQASLIPAVSPHVPCCTIASFWEAARQVSGDFYDFVRLKNGHWAIIVADVADKGVPAALFMAVSRTILRAVASSRDDPAYILQRTNELILSDSDSDLFVTVFIAIWDPGTLTLSYASGGHNPPLLIHSDGSTSQLHARGMALGVLEEARFETRHVRLERDEMVLFYTDGITEAINEDYDEFGVDRLRWIVRSTRHLPAPEIVSSITAAVQDHAGNMPQFDDITMVVLKRSG